MFKVCVDAGHGGKNIGTETPDGSILEKDVNLAIAKAFHRNLSRLMWFTDCKSTRESDRHVLMRQRGVVSKRHGSKLVYTIHCNNLPDRVADGVRCFYWPGNETGKAIARAVADAFPSPLRQKTAAVAAAAPGAQQNVLKVHKATAVLVEVGFLDDPEDAASLQDPKIIDGIVAALLVGVAEARRLIP